MLIKIWREKMDKTWTMEISRQTTAKKERVWELWTDVANWNRWDSTVEGSELHGNFSVGTKGVTKPVGGPKYKFEITNCKLLETFTNSTYLPLCKADFILILGETQDRLLITYRVEMTGFLTFFFSKVIGEIMAKGLPKGMEDLITYAEKSN
jgi:hypothetical protein